MGQVVDCLGNYSIWIFIITCGNTQFILLAHTNCCLQISYVHACLPRQISSYIHHKSPHIQLTYARPKLWTILLNIKNSFLRSTSLNGWFISQNNSSEKMISTYPYSLLETPYRIMWWHFLSYKLSRKLNP